MQDVDRKFVHVALAWLIVGTVFGFWMGATNSMNYASLHVAMLLPGFVTLAIYGLLYKLWPEMKEGAIAVWQFWIAVVAEFFLVVGSFQFLANGSVMIVAPASAAIIVSVLMMGWLFWTRAKA
jgi:hypothetical protein